ncbi:hypothetical protein CP532_3340 [Ophiocordyceps camponoti-leonardi (nom. inval.)]|nr:hypothetical protein CP532_3340 [Ophiocordyceps camponoti-leonardi (nom. inval.)]
MHLSKIFVVIPFFYYMGASALTIASAGGPRNQRHRDLDDMRRVPPAIPIEVPEKDVLKREISLINDPKRKFVDVNGGARPARLGAHSHIKREEEISLSRSGQRDGPEGEAIA